MFFCLGLQNKADRDVLYYDLLNHDILNHDYIQLAYKIGNFLSLKSQKSSLKFNEKSLFPAQIAGKRLFSFMYKCCFVYFISIFFSTRMSAESVFPSPFISDAAFVFSVPIIILARVTRSATVTESSPLISPRIF